MEGQNMIAEFVKGLKIGEVYPIKSKFGNILIGNILFNGAFYSVIISADQRNPKKMNITVTLPVYNTSNMAKDAKARRAAESEASGIGAVEGYHEQQGAADIDPAEAESEDVLEFLNK